MKINYLALFRYHNEESVLVFAEFELLDNYSMADTKCLLVYNPANKYLLIINNRKRPVVFYGLRK